MIMICNASLQPTPVKLCCVPRGTKMGVGTSLPTHSFFDTCAKFRIFNAYEPKKKPSFLNDFSLIFQPFRFQH